MNAWNVLTVRHLQAIFTVLSAVLFPTKFLAVHLYFNASGFLIFLINSDPFWYMVYFALSCNGNGSSSAYQLMSGIGLPIALQGISFRLLSKTITSAGGGTWNWGSFPTVQGEIKLYDIKHQSTEGIGFTQCHIHREIVFIDTSWCNYMLVVMMMMMVVANLWQISELVYFYDNRLSIMTSQYAKNDITHFKCLPSWISNIFQIPLWFDSASGALIYFW